MDKLLYDYAISMVGIPYHWGGNNPLEGFDCSGFVIELLKSSIAFPSTFDDTSQGLFNRFNLEPARSEPRFGALAFFGGSATSIRHVSMFLDDFRIIESGGGARNTTSVREAAKQNAFVRVRPYTLRSDLVSILMPPWPWVRRAN